MREAGADVVIPSTAALLSSVKGLDAIDLH